MEKRDKGRYLGIFLPVNLLQLSNILLLAFLPFPLLCGCSGPVQAEGTETEITIYTKADTGETVYDIFVYDRDGNLDSYRQEKGEGKVKARVSSASHEGTTVCIADSPIRSYRWEDIRTLDRIRKMAMNLDEERPGQMVKVAEGKGNTLECRSIAASVMLRSLVCDFSGREYEDKPLRDIRIYLSGACFGHSLVGDGKSDSFDFINVGGLDEITTARLRNRSFVCKDFKGEIGSKTEMLNWAFLSYPDTKGEESAGSPYTRLVIEGTVDGQRCWWPISINRKDGGNGLERGCRYLFDIKLTRKGADNPWTAVDMETAESSVKVTDWIEKEVQHVGF